MSELPPHREALAQHIIISCLESGCDWLGWLPDAAELDWDAWTVEYVRGRDDGSIEVEASQPFTESVRRSRGSRMHPPEYDTYEGTVHGFFAADWSEDPFMGEYTVHFETEGGAPSPPDPDPHADI